MSTIKKDISLSLRELADYLDAHPVLKNGAAGNVMYWNYTTDKAEAAEVARSVGECRKTVDDNNLTLVKDFGSNFMFYACFSRNIACERVVVGKKVIPAEAECVLPARPEREEDIVEWRCGSVLSSETSTAVQA